MVLADLGRRIEIRDRPRRLERTVERAGDERELLGGKPDEFAPRPARDAMHTNE